MNQVVGQLLFLSESNQVVLSFHLPGVIAGGGVRPYSARETFGFFFVDCLLRVEVLHFVVQIVPLHVIFALSVALEPSDILKRNFEIVKEVRKWLGPVEL